MEALAAIDTAHSSDAELACFACLKAAAVTQHDRCCALPTPGIDTAE